MFFAKLALALPFVGAAFARPVLVLVDGVVSPVVGGVVAPVLSPVLSIISPENQTGIDVLTAVTELKSAVVRPSYLFVRL